MNYRHRKKRQGEYLVLLKDKCLSINYQQVICTLRCVWGKLPRIHRWVLSFLIPIVLLLAIIPWPQSRQPEASDATDKRVSVDINVNDLNDLSSQKSLEVSKPVRRNTAWIDYTVQNGDTLSKIFKANDLPLSDLNALVSIEGEDKPLSHIKPGQLIRYKLTVNGELDILQVEQKDQSIMFFRLSNGGYGRSK